MGAMRVKRERRQLSYRFTLIMDDRSDREVCHCAKRPIPSAGCRKHILAPLRAVLLNISGRRLSTPLQVSGYSLISSCGVPDTHREGRKHQNSAEMPKASVPRPVRAKRTQSQGTMSSSSKWKPRCSGRSEFLAVQLPQRA